MRFIRLFSALAGVVNCLGVSEWAAAYTFTNVVDTTMAAPNGSFSGFGYYSSISGGTVAFLARYNSGEDAGIFTGSGGPLTTIAKTGDPVPSGTFFSGFSFPSFDGSTVAFPGYHYSNSTHGLYVGSGGPVTMIARQNAPAPVGDFYDFPEASISGGRLAFLARYNQAKEWGIFLRNQGTTATIVKTGDPAPLSTFTSFGDISLSGETVTFVGSYYDSYGESGTALSTSNGSTCTTIVKTGDAAPLGTFTEIDGGALSGNKSAFSAWYNNNQNQGLFTVSGGTINTVVKYGDTAPSGVFDGFADMAFNSDILAFRGTYDTVASGGVGLFVSRDGMLSTIIKIGDPLFGSSVTSLQMGDSDLDALGNMAFTYQLADGRSGIAITAVPEPSTLVLAGIWAIGTTVYASLRRKQCPAAPVDYL